MASVVRAQLVSVTRLVASWRASWQASELSAAPDAARLAGRWAHGGESGSAGASHLAPETPRAKATEHWRRPLTICAPTDADRCATRPPGCLRPASLSAQRAALFQASERAPRFASLRPG